jgi:hypothetical protein
MHPNRCLLSYFSIIDDGPVLIGSSPILKTNFPSVFSVLMRLSVLAFQRLNGKLSLRQFSFPQNFDALYHMQDHRMIFLNRPYYLNAGNGDDEHLKIHVNSAILCKELLFQRPVREYQGERGGSST